MTYRHDRQVVYSTLLVADEEFASAGASGSRTATAAVGGDNCALLIALAPPGVSAADVVAALCVSSPPRPTRIIGRPGQAYSDPTQRAELSLVDVYDTRFLPAVIVSDPPRPWRNVGRPGPTHTEQTQQASLSLPNVVPDVFFAPHQTRAPDRPWRNVGRPGPSYSDPTPTAAESLPNQLLPGDFFATLVVTDPPRPTRVIGRPGPSYSDPTQTAAESLIDVISTVFFPAFQTHAPDRPWRNVGRPGPASADETQSASLSLPATPFLPGDLFAALVVTDPPRPTRVIGRPGTQDLDRTFSLAGLPGDIPLPEAGGLHMLPVLQSYRPWMAPSTFRLHPFPFESSLIVSMPGWVGQPVHRPTRLPRPDGTHQGETVRPLLTSAEIAAPVQQQSAEPRRHGPVRLGEISPSPRPLITPAELRAPLQEPTTVPHRSGRAPDSRFTGPPPQQLVSVPEVLPHAGTLTPSAVRRQTPAPAAPLLLEPAYHLLAGTAWLPPLSEPPHRHEQARPTPQPLPLVILQVADGWQPWDVPPAVPTPPDRLPLTGETRTVLPPSVQDAVTYQVWQQGPTQPPQRPPSSRPETILLVEADPDADPYRAWDSLPVLPVRDRPGPPPADHAQPPGLPVSGAEVDVPSFQGPAAPTVRFVPTDPRAVQSGPKLVGSSWLAALPPDVGSMALPRRTGKVAPGQAVLPVGEVSPAFPIGIWILPGFPAVPPRRTVPATPVQAPVPIPSDDAPLPVNGAWPGPVRLCWQRRDETPLPPWQPTV
ncbi:MAG: hypothetical protein IT429_16965, partial [Gemmataceae bacterium]|nr:hypothetical protein [Gemmataceae bacterium]